MPKVRVPVDFIRPDGQAAENTAATRFDQSWYWTPHGYLILDRPAFARATIYFVPQAEFDEYLDAHTPEEDETGTAPPAPTKPSKKP